MKELIAQKISMKKRMPKFERQEAHVKARLSRSGWRKPRGFQSKMRLQRKGYNAIVKVGYRTPRMLRGRLISGLLETIVISPSDLKNIQKDQIALIPRTLGNRKRLEVLKEAKKLKIRISNYSNIDTKISEIENNLVERKKRRSESKSQKTEKAKKLANKEDEKKNKGKKKEKKIEKPKAELKKTPDEKETKSESKKKETKK
jgi:large subunit ribosomal protein L32e